MSAPIRGQEVTAKISVEGEDYIGSWIKLTNFNWTPRAENVELEFTGETFSDLDQRFDGHDVSFTAHNLDSKIVDFIYDMQSRSEDTMPPARVIITITEVYREDGSTSTGTFSQGVMKIDKRGHGSRKDYVTADCSCKFKRFDAQA